MNRRDFLRSTSAAAFGLGMPGELFAQSAKAPARTGTTWDAGSVAHILPQVSDTRMLVKASFNTAVGTPSLRVGETTVRGRMSDTRGEHWQFHATDLNPGERYTLTLTGRGGRGRCPPWGCRTFPGPHTQPETGRFP